MSRNFGVTRSGDLDSLPSWISDHLWEGSSFMTDEVNQSPVSPMEGSPPPETNSLIAIHPSVEEKTNIMTLEELDALREAYSFPPRVRVRLPEEGETITSTRPGEVLGGLILSCFSDKHCNNPPRLYSDEPKVFEEIFKSVKKTGCFSVLVLLELKSFCRVFVSPGSMASGTTGENGPSGEAPSSSGDVGEYPNSHEHARQQSPSRDDSVECLGSIRIELRRILPHIPDLTLLRWLGERFSILFLIRILARARIPHQNLVRIRANLSNLTRMVLPHSFSEITLYFPRLIRMNYFVAMSKRISFKKLGEKLKKSKNGSSSGIPTPAKGVVIGEKRAGENLASSASKRGKVDDGSKGKGVDREPEGKKKATSPTNAPTTPATASSRPGEGTSATLGAVLGPTASILGSPSVVEKLLRGVIPPADKEKVEKLTLDQTATKLFHANDELAKTNSDRDSLADKVERSGVLVVELREALIKAKESAVEEFKSSSKFMVAIEDSASKYFGEGFDFCKVQLRRHHPDLAIDLEGTMVDQDLLAEQDEVAEKKEKEEVGENEGLKKTQPLFKLFFFGEM
ncbi:hypothetical protein Acr_15g0008980 [Actinidia rufa]|uniref:Uncharacterized protein n=1 Tax=Actinidia rufa TaxID=165716 RepID=A0A7J0FVT0_9ERIC|nr:hypothetical protein Acr_15g0008980 [Actinidia rufa]